jgi:hypothetical protein
MEVFNEFADCAPLMRKAAQPYQQRAQQAGNELRVEADADLGVIYADCKIACNNDPLKGCFRVQ